MISGKRALQVSWSLLLLEAPPSSMAGFPLIRLRSALMIGRRTYSEAAATAV
jgi:hypothetical protein